MRRKNEARTRLYQEAMRASIFGIVVNLLLGLIKLVAGLVAHSFALLSDAFNSIGDVFASIVVVLSLRISQRPPDDEHPYGHSRAETIGAFVVSQLIILSACLIGWEALKRLDAPHPMPPVWALWVAGGNVVIKEFLYRYKLRMSQKTGSSALLANAWDHRSDALCSLAVLVGLGMIVLWGKSLLYADEVAALIVVALIVFNASRLSYNSMREMMDMQADPALLTSVRELAMQHAEVRLVETIHVRKSGLEHFVDMHIQVDPEMSVVKAHQIGHEVKDEILQAHPNIRDVLVHIEPFYEPCEEKQGV